MISQQFDGDGPCAWILVCDKEHVAAVVLGPGPAPLACSTWLAQRNLPIAWILDTHVSGARPDLWAREQLPPDADTPGPSAFDPSRYPRVRPVRPYVASSNRSRAVMLQVGDRSIELSPSEGGGGRYHSRAPERDPFQVQFASAVIEVGQVQIEVLPLPDRSDAVAYRVGDRVFTGAPVLSGTRVSAENGTPSSLLKLEPDTIVCPGEVRDGVGLSSVALERLALARDAQRTMTPAPTVVAPRRDLPIGQLSRDGTRTIGARELWPVLEKLLLVDVREAGEGGETLPGAELCASGDLRRRLKDEARHRPLLFACEDGVASRSAANQVLRMGFSWVYWLEGGLRRWREEHMPTCPVSAAAVDG